MSSFWSVKISAGFWKRRTGVPSTQEQCAASSWPSRTISIVFSESLGSERFALGTPPCRRTSADRICWILRSFRRAGKQHSSMAGRKRDNGEALSAFRLPWRLHDLVADEIKGLAERSLVLTLPKEPTDNDDSLLTDMRVL